MVVESCWWAVRCNEVAGLVDYGMAESRHRLARRTVVSTWSELEMSTVHEDWRIADSVWLTGCKGTDWTVGSIGRRGLCLRITDLVTIDMGEDYMSEGTRFEFGFGADDERCVDSDYDDGVGLWVAGTDWTTEGTRVEDY